MRARVILERVGWTRSMLEKLGALPLASLDLFTADERNIAAAESYLRRALESLFDLGRHMLAKSFGQGVTEYKEIAVRLARLGVLENAEADRMREMAGYRNRLTHFYHEVSAKELYDISAHRASDIGRVLDALLAWLRRHPERLDESL
jgi:uncharacterized protein YutE (UPF0331/DUF86 family)